MKILDRILALLFSACLLLSVGIGSAIAIASTPAYYHWQFEATGMYATKDENGVETPNYVPCINGNEELYGQFTNEQLNEIVDHIICYLFTDTESFALVMDDVRINGVMMDDVSVFGDTAVKHMSDVKILLRDLSLVAVICGGFCLLALIYFIFRARRGQGGVLFKYSLIFYGVFIGSLVAFCLYTLAQVFFYQLGMEYYTYLLWMNFHFLIFPDPSKAVGSFFNDTLTMLLSLDLFMCAIVIVLGLLVLFTIGWLVFARRLDRCVQATQV